MPTNMCYAREVKRLQLKLWHALSMSAVCMVIALGCTPLLHALINFFSIESESGQASNALSVSDTTASGNSAIRFAAQSTAADITLALAGDIQLPTNNLLHALSTSNLVMNTIRPDYVLVLGDNQYDNGTLSDFNNYYSQTWGRPAIKSITYPVPGNHEYNTSGATGYYSYFNAANNSINGHTVTGPAHQGYYAFDIGQWRVYAMNSEANLAAQNTWMAADMAANPRQCKMFTIHRPYWDYGTTHDGEMNSADEVALFRTFYDNGGDLLFAGHEHNYQRFMAANPNTNTATATGIQSFIVGTGGTTNMYNVWGSTINNAHNLIQTYDGSTWGVLRVVLKADNSYTWAFMPVDGGTYTDSGSGTCH